MVLFKRKPVKFVPRPDSLDDNSEVWVIETSGEVFDDYDKYLNRRDFYLQKVFTCEATGHSTYTYFEAMESEAEAAKEINSIFPEGLRARVLEFVQFHNTARMDDLVNEVYDHFREHYMVGDWVSIETENGRRHGTIKRMTDTSQLHSIFSGQPHDDQFRSYTYTIDMEDNAEEVTKYKASELQRDRRVYSKLVLKQFLRGAVSREAWNGAPWMIKEHLAKRYKISTKVPDAKTRDAVMAAKKAQIAAQNGHAPPQHSQGPNPHYHNSPYSNGVRGHAQGPTPVNFPNAGPVPPHYVLPPGYEHGPPPMHALGDRPPAPPNVVPYGHPSLPPHLRHVPPPGSSLPIGLPFQNNFMQYQALNHPVHPPPPNHLPPHHPQHPGPHIPHHLHQHPAPPFVRPFEPIKYPIEDLRIKAPHLTINRPTLKFFSDDVPDGVEPPPEDKQTGIQMKSMGPLLCIWDTLNVHDTIYTLDSFTFDDFVEAIGFFSEDVECELLTEMHCAVLKQYVNNSGKFQVPLPSMTPEEDQSEEEESEEEETPETEPIVRTTRSSLRKSEANQIVVKPRTPTPEPPKQLHKAVEFLAEFNWIEQCKIRNFREGGWQAILVGLLHRLSFNPTQKDACDEILAKLVPPDEEPSVETIANNYVYLDVNLRISALDLALRLTVTTEHFREQLQAASQEMTRLRKEKIDFQKKRRELADELFKLDIDRKIQLPNNTPASPSGDKQGNPDVSMTGTEVAEEVSEKEEVEVNNRKPRKAAREIKRKRESEAVKKEKAKKAKIEAAKTKQQKEWEKLLEAIENKKDEVRTCEASINELDDDLRETLVHRSKILGKDRFCNKYHWFESNGMPFGGVPNSSTADHGYANGRLWVQGPDEWELQPNLEESAMAQDKAEFGWTVPMRKAREEGLTHLSKSSEWGYYDDPEDIDKLIAWLDERGVREKALRKQLLAFRDKIAEYMKVMKEYVEAEKSTEDEEEDKPRTTRNRASKGGSDEENKKCLKWTNSIMREQEGYNHAEEYEEPKKAKKGVAVKKGKGRK